MIGPTKVKDNSINRRDLARRVAYGMACKHNYIGIGKVEEGIKVLLEFIVDELLKGRDLEVRGFGRMRLRKYTRKLAPSNLGLGMHYTRRVPYYIHYRQPRSWKMEKEESPEDS